MFELLLNWPAWCGKPTAKKIAEFENATELKNNFNDLYTRAVDLFKWNGGPDTINWRFAEACWLNDGQFFVVHERDGYLGLAGIATGSVNVNGVPVEANCYGLNGFNKTYKLWVKGSNLKELRTPASGLVPAGEALAVLGKDNPSSYPFVNYIIVAAERMTQAMRSADVIVENMKQPAIITCDESLVDTAVKALNDRKRNHTAVLSTGSLAFDSVKVWKTDVEPAALTAMWEHLERIETRANETLGIPDASQVDKKERLLVDEVNANEETVDNNIERRLSMRKEFIEHLQEAFPGDFDDLTVELRVQPKDGIMEEDIETEGEDNEQVQA